MLSELTSFTKSGGPLTKRIELDASGRARSDGSACIMTRGVAQRAPISCVANLAELIGALRSNQAIALGSLRPGLPDEVKIAPKRVINGPKRPDAVARTANNFFFRSGSKGFDLLDFDSKGMPADVAERLAREGGFWPALLSAMP